LVVESFNCLIGDFILEAIPAIIPIFCFLKKKAKGFSLLSGLGNPAIKACI